MYKYSKILNKILNIQKYNRKKETLTLPLYGWNDARTHLMIDWLDRVLRRIGNISAMQGGSTHLNSKQSINTIQQNVLDLSGYYPVLLHVHVFTCTKCNGYVHVHTSTLVIYQIRVYQYQHNQYMCATCT